MSGSLPSILLVTTSDKRRGAEVFGAQLRDGLPDFGWSVDAVCLTESRDTARVDLEPLTAVSPEDLGRFNLAVLRALRQRRRRTKPGVIVAMGGPTLRYCAMARRDSKLAYVSIGEPSRWIRSDYSRMLNRALIRKVDRLIAVSEATATQTTELFPSVADRTVVAHTGVPEALLQLEPGPNEGSLRVLVVGSLSDEKDPLLAARVGAALDGATIRFVGSGPLRNQLEEVKERGERIEIFDSVDDLHPHWEWAHVLLLTSRTEGLPGVVLEAAAAGVPAVGADVGGVSEALEHGVSGLLVERRLESFVEAMQQLDDDRRLLGELSNRGRERVADRFTLRAAFRRYDEALKTLIRP